MASNSNVWLLHEEPCMVAHVIHLFFGEEPILLSRLGMGLCCLLEGGRYSGEEVLAREIRSRRWGRRRRCSKEVRFLYPPLPPLENRTQCMWWALPDCVEESDHIVGSRESKFRVKLLLALSRTEVDLQQRGGSRAQTMVLMVDFSHHDASTDITQRRRHSRIRLVTSRN